ncbi:MAG: MucR family transcriptional regulator [Betaproteobacteria bacterium]|nr:MAG: MucR family transcriptional regulator [Betaproteobacteria bacterium]
MTENTPERAALLERTTQIISAYAGNNALPSSELPNLITAVFGTVSGLGAPAPEPAPEPAVPIQKSVTKHAIICLECGKPNKMLKRHLATAHGLTPDEYRAKWALPATYPLVAPEYAVMRSKLAKEFGLGRKSTKRSTSRRKTR